MDHVYVTKTKPQPTQSSTTTTLDSNSSSNNSSTEHSTPLPEPTPIYVRRYAQFHLKEIFQLMGCKAINSFQMSAEVLKSLQGYQTPSCAVEEEVFLEKIKEMLVSHSYKPKSLEDFKIARKIQDREQSICILLGGTSGCGKSTLASLLANKIGLSTVLSTDNIRHLLRNFAELENSPVLWASSYHAGECITEPDLDPEARIIKGFEQQNDLVYTQLDTLMTTFEQRNESIIIEGVHLSIDVMLRLMSRHPSCIPFLIYISNESKHAERFAIRAKYMTLEPRLNKYIKYFDNICLIQNYLCKGADEHLIPKIDNTNVDRSLAILHRTVFGCLRTIEKYKRKQKELKEKSSAEEILEKVEKIEKIEKIELNGKDTAEKHKEKKVKDKLKEKDKEKDKDKEKEKDKDKEKKEKEKDKDKEKGKEKKKEKEKILKQDQPINVLFDSQTQMASTLHRIYSKIENDAMGSKEMLEVIKQRRGKKIVKERILPQERNSFVENIGLWYGSLGS